MDLQWIPPLKDGGSKILGYWVEYKEEGTEAWVKVTASIPIYSLTVLLFFLPRILHRFMEK